MDRKLLFIFLLLLIFFWVGCSSYYREYGREGYEVHYVHYQNNSSYNIFIQYFLDGEWYTQWHNYDGAEGDVYRITVDELPINSNYTIGFNSSDYFPISKILIVDTDTQRLLRKIDTDWDSFINMLITEKRIEKSATEIVTYYDHYFIIVDEFINE